MNRLPYVMLALALTVAAVVEIATYSLLPATVPARYAVDGTPRGATLFGLAVHLLVVSANLSDGRRLSPAFIVLLGAFVTALVGWVAAMLWRFRRPSR